MDSMDIWSAMDEVEAMDLDHFWGWIALSRAVGDQEGLPQDEALAQLLSLRDLPEVASFKGRFSELSNAANCDAMHALLGGSDDGFHYNISGLIAMGREAYEGALADPAAFGLPVQSYEIIEYAANDAYEEPSRSQLRAKALPRHERALLDGFVAIPDLGKPGPRI